MKILAAVTLRIGFLLGLLAFLMAAQASMEEQNPSDRAHLDSPIDQ